MVATDCNAMTDTWQRLLFYILAWAERAGRWVSRVSKLRVKVSRVSVSVGNSN